MSKNKKKYLEPVYKTIGLQFESSIFQKNANEVVGDKSD